MGGLRPIDLDSKEKAVQLDFTTPKKEESFSENQIHRLEYEANPPIKVGDYVYAYVPKVRPRGFDVQVRNLDSILCPASCIVRKPNSFFAPEQKEG